MGHGPSAISLATRIMFQYIPPSGSPQTHTRLFTASTSSRPKNIEVEESREITFVARTTSSEQDYTIDVMHIFQAQSSPYPERLPAGRESHSRTVSTCTSTLENMVVAGTAATNDTIQVHMVTLRSSMGSCSRAMISDEWLLTAGHCQVWAGGRAFVNGDTTGSGVGYQVKKLVEHPGSKLSTKGMLEQHDIASVRLSERINDARPVGLSTLGRGPGRKCCGGFSRRGDRRAAGEAGEDVVEEVQQEVVAETVGRVPKVGLIVAGLAGGIGVSLMTMLRVWFAPRSWRQGIVGMNTDAGASSDTSI